MLENRIERYPSPAVRHAFLAAHTLRALKHWENATDRDRAAYRRAGEFLERVLRGDSVVRHRRVTTTAADEAADFGWAVSAYSLHAHREQKTERENLSDVFNQLKQALVALSEGEEPRGGDRPIRTLMSFFESLRHIAGRTVPESTDRVTLRSVSRPQSAP